MMHSGVLGKVDAAHASATYMAEQLILPKEIPFMPTFEQIVALPGRNEIGRDQLFGQSRAFKFGGRDAFLL
jgi:hypothetical protein